MFLKEKKRLIGLNVRFYGWLLFLTTIILGKLTRKLGYAKMCFEN